jgi:uncharacterized protein YjiS (DUF1127 family)
MSAIVAPLAAAYVLHTQSAQTHAQGADAPFSRATAGKSLAQHLVSAWSRFLAWRMRRQTRLILGTLDDRMLADIGLRRSEIDAVLGDLEPRKLRWPM